MEVQIDLGGIRDVFFEEAAEHVAQLEAGALRLEDSRDQELLDAIFRCAHSIKGAAGTIGFNEIASFTHQLETLLDRLREGEIVSPRRTTDLLLRAADVLKTQLESARTGSPDPNPEKTQAVVRDLMAAHGAASGPESPTPALAAGGEDRTWIIRFVPAADIFRLGMDPLFVLRDLAQLGEVEEVRPDLSRLPSLDGMDTTICYLSWTLRLRTAKSEQEIRDVFAFVEDAAEIEIAPAEKPPEQAGAAPRSEPAPRQAAQDLSLRVSTAKVDKLIDLVGELVIAQSMAGQILGDFTIEKLGRLQETMLELDRHTRELQERVMSIRMVPIGTLFGRFPRVVRDTAVSLGKLVRLEITGADTELDKGMAEQISDPLTHLIRNAVDHGLESPDERRQSGKPEEGRILLNAHHQGGNVLVEVSDDGRGLDLWKIRTKAIERGLIEAGAELSEEQTLALIFQPGFSTSEVVSGISGRGVGMDVVKRNVETLNGSVAILNRPGKGATFRIKLPLTLAILDGLAMKVGAETYVVPLLSISESIRPKRGQLRTVPGAGETILVRGEPIPLVRLHRVLGVPTEATDPCESLVVVVEHIGSRLALLVNELLGQQQVVIKSLEQHYRKVEGVMGATILGDGRAALILDIAGIVSLAKAQACPAGQRSEE